MVLNWLLQQTTTNNQNKTLMLSYSSLRWFQIRQYLINHEKKQNSFNTINTYFVFYYFYSLRLQSPKLDVIRLSITFLCD